MEITDFTTDLFRLDGKVAIVTGGTTGLGQSFTLALAAAGADVFVPGLDDDEGATAALVEARGRKMEFMAADLAAPGVPQQIVDRCLERFGAVDILVNSAGICLLDDVESFGREKWD